MGQKEAVEQLSGERTKRGALPGVEARDNIDSSLGLAFPISAMGGSGIASPLTEQSREVQEQTVFDPTGAFSVTVEAITELTLLDANGGTVVMRFTVPIS